MPVERDAAQHTPEGRLIRALLLGTPDFGRQLDDFEGDEALLAGLFLATVASLAARRFGPHPDGKAITRFVSRSMRRERDPVRRRETEAVLWFLLGDLELSDLLPHDVIMEVALDAAQPLVADLDMSTADVDAVIAATENSAQWAVDHKTKISPPPDRNTLAGWAEWRRKVASAVAEGEARRA